MIIFCCHRYLILGGVYIFANFTFYTINISFQVGKISCQVAEWVSDMFYDSYLVKNKKIADNSTTTNPQEKAHSVNPQNLKFLFMLGYN
jgi:hypothetical protein